MPDPLPRLRVESGMNRWLHLLLLSGCIVWIAGCASLPRRGGVAVSLVSVVPQQSSLFETTALVTLRFTNEAAQPVELTGGTHRIFVNGTYIGRAVTNERLSLPRLGTSTQAVTAHLENFALLRKAQEIGNVPTVEYRIESRLIVGEDADIGAIATGQLDLRGLMEQAGFTPAPAEAAEKAASGR
jgi:LEA14-like dessication related protein